ncbi:hypothetical protein F4818DRAFT_189291 [Hypoxylon cercidicola]|nr:hypothetical protein F4818DRAFT_189291 [Hypoxylon cercidicola]
MSIYLYVMTLLFPCLWFWIVTSLSCASPQPAALCRMLLAESRSPLDYESLDLSSISFVSSSSSQSDNMGTRSEVSVKKRQVEQGDFRTRVLGHINGHVLLRCAYLPHAVSEAINNVGRRRKDERLFDEEWEEIELIVFGTPSCPKNQDSAQFHDCEEYINVSVDESVSLFNSEDEDASDDDDDSDHNIVNKNVSGGDDDTELQFHDAPNDQTMVRPGHVSAEHNQVLASNVEALLSSTHSEVSVLTPELISHHTLEQVSSLTCGQISALTVKQISVFTLVQVASFIRAQVSSLSLN